MLRQSNKFILHSALQLKPFCFSYKGLFKKFVQQGRRQREGRGVQFSTLSPPSNENATGGLFQQAFIESTSHRHRNTSDIVH